MKYFDVRQASALWKIEERRVTMLCRSGRIPGAVKQGKLWLIPADSLKPVDARTKEARVPEISVDSSDGAVLAADDLSYTPSGAAARVVKAFQHKYGKRPSATAFTPYRLCPLGAHLDHNLGPITGFAIDKGLHIAYGSKQNGIIEIASLQFPKRAQWHVACTPAIKQGDWADPLRGACIALNRRYPLRVGLCAVFDGELPIGGLSSSAAIILTFISALSSLNDIQLSAKELISIAQEAQNEYVGVSAGKLDFNCEIYCRKNALLFMDTRNDNHELFPVPDNMKPFSILLLYSGVERSLLDHKYNMRVDELRAAAYTLLAFAGLECGKFSETNMRDVPSEVFEQYKDKLPDSLRKRAEHFYSESERVMAGVEAWKCGDIQAFGQLCFASGKSSIENWETGSPELIKLYKLLTQTPGIYGGRFAGSGFKGCCLALADPAAVPEITKKITEEYLMAFPRLKGKFSIHICNSADGVKL